MPRADPTRPEASLHKCPFTHGVAVHSSAHLENGRKPCSASDWSIVRRRCVSFRHLCDFKLRRDKHAQGEQRWEPNDLNDIVSLPIAAVYCDIVVTEKQWVNRRQRAGVERRYGTKLLANLSELAEALGSLHQDVTMNLGRPAVLNA